MTGSDPGIAPAPRNRKITLDDRLLAEAVRLSEQQDVTDEDHQTGAAAAAARAAGGDFESRLVRRACGLEIAAPLREALARLRRATGLIILVGLVLATAAGAATARAALGAPQTKPVNFYLVVGGVLGLQSGLLVLWCVLMTLRLPAPAVGALGGIALAAGQRLAGWLRHGPHHLAAVGAFGSLLSGRGVGKWTVSALSHAFWLFFTVGALVTMLALLSARHYAFGWETTILSDRTYVPLTRALAMPPALVGFDTPDETQIRQSQWTGAPSTVDDFERERAWSSLLIGCILVYGLVPRAVLTVLALGLRRRSMRRWRLCITRPELARLRPALMPDRASLGIIDPAVSESGSPAPGSPAAPVEDPRPGRGEGPPAIVGLEIEPPASAWPPPVRHAEGARPVRWRDLGLIDSREDRRRVLQELTSAADRPRTLVVVCDLTSTPDRGLGTFLRALSATTGESLAVALTAGDRLRRRAAPEDVAARVEDWRRLAADCGVSADRVVEVDLDHLTDHTAGTLAGLLGDGVASSAPPPRRIGMAFDLIVEHARSAAETSSLSGQAELHRAIGRLYRDEAEAWGRLLRGSVARAAELPHTLRAGAERMTGLLPARLRLRPRWMAAGAMAGALGCVAAATLLTPAAIAGLPIWAGLGAAVMTLMQPGRKDEPKEDSTGETLDLTGVTRAATLFALLLELQGRSEAAIGRLIDETIGPDDEVELRDAGQVRHWLDERQHRLDMALAAEQGR